MSRALVLFALLLTLSGCGYDTLYSGLDEAQANDMLALLLREGYDARKVSSEKTWTLEIARAQLPQAVDTLKIHGLPRDGYQSLGEIFQKEGFVSSPLEERARLIYGLSQELSRTVSNIDGVVMARVHLAIPERNPMAEDQAPSSASVFIKHQRGVALNKHTSSIKALVVNSVEGLPYDNVTVSFFEAEPAEASTLVTTRKASVLPGTLQSPYYAAGGAVAATLIVLLLLKLIFRRRPRVIA